MQKRYLFLLTLLLLSLLQTKAFTFRELLVTPTSLVTNVTTTYTVSYQYYRTNTFASTAWSTTLLTSSDTATLTFPNQFTLGAITCRYSINSTGVYTDNICAVSGNVITLNNIFNSVYLYTFSLVIGNVVNPYPSGTTSHFYGTIGSSTSNTTGTNSVVTITTGTSACSFTFDPNSVETNPANMIISLTTVNQFPNTGYVGVQFPFTRKWSQDLDSTRYMPITDSSMACSSKSANVNTGIQCSGSTASALVTVTNVATSTLTASSTLSFSINNFNSPPTNQPVDAVTITTYTSSGSAIDKCTAYVTGLLPKVIDSSSFTIAESSGASMVVNKQYTITFSITITDIISTTDYVTIVFPTGTTINNFPGATLGGTLGINTATSTYASQKLTIYFLGTTTIPASSQLFITVSNFVAPPSTLTTNNFVLTFLNTAGYPKMVSYQTITAVTGTLSGSVTQTLTSVNTVTSYTFSVTTTNALLSSGSFKIVFPIILQLANLTTCAAVIGTNLASSPVCAVNFIENSITFTTINSSSSNIQAQTFSVKVEGITNPPSTKPTSSFTLTTYYGTGGQVDQGTVAGVTSTQATIDYMTASPAASSRVNSATAVTYYLSFKIANPVPAGGYIIAYFPTAIAFDLTAAASQCSIMINSSTEVSTLCTAALSSSYIFNFTNPLTTTATANTNITLVIAGAATNPGSTKPFSPFSLYTYYSDGYLIASMVNALTYNTNTASSFSYNQVSRVSQTNAAYTTYTVTLAQPADLEVSAKIIVVFPATAVPQGNSTCSMVYNSATTAVACSLSGSTFTVTSIPSVISGGTTFQILFTNILNPYSFSTMSPISSTTKTSNTLYVYSAGQTTNSLQTTTATSFSSITYTYSPRILNSPIDLALSFQLSQYVLLPTYLLLSIDTYFNEGTLVCGSFINFVGACTAISNNTVKITGTFNSSEMGLTVSGFSSTSSLPTGTTYTTLASFDSSNGQIDRSLTQISFSLTCATPCKTCSSSNTSACLSCYSDTTITPSVYYYASLSSCYTICPATTYNAATLTCEPCSSNCYTCLSSATFCTKCLNTSTYPYLNITSTTVQTCVSACVAGMYPRTTSDPAQCVACVTPCATCTTQTACITCAQGYYLYNTNSSCISACPADTTIANNVTNTCDSCSSICLTCSVLTSNCTSCSAPNVYYLGSCQSSCPTGGTLAPYNGICTPCNSKCLYCSGTITNCTQCNLASLYPYLVNNDCLASCPEKYYNVSLTGQCISCATAGINCVNCSSASTCLSCDLGFVFYNSQCLSYTPTGYVNISGVAVACTGDCKTCSIATDNCTSCKTLNLEGYTCVATCASGTIPISQVCTACLSPCATCTTTTSTCLSCLATLSPLRYLTGTTCQLTCPSSTYPNATTLKCESCVSPCSTCTSYTACLSCVSSYFLYNSTCSTTCPAGYVGISNQCVACTNNCKTCVNATNICLTCLTNTYFWSSKSECVTSCDPGLFIDYTNGICVGCTAPCNTCTGSATYCTSCITGYLLNNTCATACPTAMFVFSGTCSYCATNCSTCTSLTNCSVCVGTSLLYNGACVTTCPATAPVVYLSTCSACSTQNCYSCTTADICTTCKSGYLFLSAQCLSSCPSNYTSNGTHCIELAQTIIDSVTTPSTFPVPFSIAGAVLLVACLMSRLQFNQTYLSGAAYSFLGILQVLALVYFLYLYYKDYYSSEPTPLLIGLAGLGYLYILNLVATLAQSIFLCYEKEFTTWKESSRLNSCFYGLVNIVSLTLSHKTRNVLFCKLFTFKVFSAKLDSVHHFRIFNVFSLLSLAHSGAAIFAAAIALKYIDPLGQIHYEAIDVIVLTSLNVLLAFFNTHKDKDFFEEVTPEGFNLHKKNKLDEDFLPDKIKIEGHDGEIEEGFLNDYSHALQSKAALRFEDGSVNEIYSESLEYVEEGQPSQQSQSVRQYEQISIQAYDMLDEKANVTAKTQKTVPKPEFESISIQADQLIEPEKQDKGIDLSDLPHQGFPNESSDFTKYNIFERVDAVVQSSIDRGVNHSAQISLKQVDMSVQKYEDGAAVDCSIQKSDLPHRDVSIQNSRISQNDVSIQPQERRLDASVAMSGRSVSHKDVEARADLKSQQNQMTIELEDEQIQMEVEQLDEGMDPKTIQYNQVSVQPTLEVDEVQPSLNSMGIQYELGDQMAYHQFQEQLQNQHTPSNIVFDDSEEHAHKEVQKELAAEKEERLEMKVDDVRTYQEELEDRIREREKQLEEMRRKIIMKERMNEKRKEEIAKIEEEKVELEEIKYNEQRPRVNSVASKPEPFKNVGKIEVKRAPQSIPLPASQELKLQSKQLEAASRREETLQEIIPREKKNPSSVHDQRDISKREQTLEEIPKYNKNASSVHDSKSSIKDGTLQEIQIKNQQPQGLTLSSKEEFYEKKSKKIEYNEIDNSLQSHEEEKFKKSIHSSIHQEEKSNTFIPNSQQEKKPNVFIPNNTHEEEQSNILIPNTYEEKKPNVLNSNNVRQQEQSNIFIPNTYQEKKPNVLTPKNVGKQEESNVFIRSKNLKKEEPPISSQQTRKPQLEFEALSDVELKSETTKKNYQPESQNMKHYEIDVEQIDHSLGGEEQLEENSELQPTGLINPYHQGPKVREKSPQSDLSGTIQEIPRQYSKIDNDKTISNTSVRAPKNQPESREVRPKINDDDVKNYYKGQINQTTHGGPNKAREIPKDNDQDRFHINRLYQRQVQREQPVPTKGQQRNNTFAMAGRAQFSDDMARKKQKEMKNPLDTKNTTSNLQKWDFKREDKQLDDQFSNNTVGNRTNLARNKQLQNFASHLVLPQESDKQETSFQKAMHKRENADKPISQKRESGYPRPKREVDEIEVHFEADLQSRELSSRGRNEMPEPPRTGYPRQLPSQASNSIYNSQEQQDVRGQILMGQMQQRPKNDDLNEYYRRKNNSKQKRRKSNSKVDRSTEKIYLQKMEKRR